jgi:hypothetical protein
MMQSRRESDETGPVNFGENIKAGEASLKKSRRTVVPFLKPEGTTSTIEQ